MAAEQVEQEIEKFLESDEASDALMFLSEQDEITDTLAYLYVGEDEEYFSVSYSANYPSEKGFKFAPYEEKPSQLIATWVKEINEWAEKNKNKSLEDTLIHACDKFLEVKEDIEERKKREGANDKSELTGPSFEEKKPEKVKDEVDKLIDSKEFLPIGSGAATKRLIQDLKSIMRSNSKEMGFTAEPVKEAKSGLENLYHWHIKLFNFEKGSGMAEDMAKFKKKSGQDFILLEARFGADYPFVPPFVRVVKPRFAFRTGHVTMGGSICMELLTMAGWNSTNDIESILIQIRCEMLGGGARLDSGANASYEYSVSEAWDAFYRAASTHGWSIKGLNPDMFKFHPDYKQ
eukprot:TRINITY_DN7784_c0_g1_i2.p1 TRINITY_DN7784_c0_g1~~TRINITY_DN7784_c0_g1_i2.p1  ORF type:complete len:357 (+),score=49.70 TRINITY_DN7784_c0_g1_i2:32-1072(+)